MALILCPNCGAKISDRAHACPKCGQELGSPPCTEQSAAPVVPAAPAAPAAPDSPVAPAAPKRPVHAAPKIVKQAPKQAGPVLSEGYSAPASDPEPKPISTPSTPPPASPSTPPRPKMLTESGRSGKILLYGLVGLLIVLVLIYIFTRHSSEMSYAPSSTEASAPVAPSSSSSGADVRDKNSDPNAFEAGSTVYTFADNTWLRSSMQKGVDYNKLELLKAGAQLTVMNIYDDWTRVKKQSDGTVGYVATDFVMPSEIYTQLVNRTTSAQRSALKMAKYRRGGGSSPPQK